MRIQHSGKRVRITSIPLYIGVSSPSAAGCGWSVSFLPLDVYNIIFVSDFYIIFRPEKNELGRGRRRLDDFEKRFVSPPFNTLVEFRAILTHAKPSTLVDSSRTRFRTACVNNDLARWNAISPGKALLLPPKNTSPHPKCTAWCIIVVVVVGSFDEQ